jgi:hypothetical protein
MLASERLTMIEREDVRAVWQRRDDARGPVLRVERWRQQQAD